MASIYEVLSYENISAVCGNIAEDNLTVLPVVITGTKILAVTFLLMNWAKRYFESLKNPDRPGLTMYNILGGILYVALILNFSWCMEMLDKGLGAYQESFMRSDVKSVYDSLFSDWAEQIEEATESEDVFTDTATATLGVVQQLFGFIGDPWRWILEILKPIGYLVNLLTFPLFLLEREFLLMLMKIAMPLVLALGALEMYRDMVKKWVLIYCAVFISGLFLILATQFCDLFYAEVSRSFNLQEEDGYVQVALFLVAVFAKVRLYKAAVTISYKIFNA